MNSTRMLIYGYGNPGRQDDGLGPAFVGRLQRSLSLSNGINIATECDYQLNIEDVSLISGMDIVIFVDASKTGPVFKLKKLRLQKNPRPFSHALSPGNLLYYCKQLYERKPEAYILAIRGYEWGLAGNLTSGAADNLDKAFLFLSSILS